MKRPIAVRAARAAHALLAVLVGLAVVGCGIGAPGVVTTTDSPPPLMPLSGTIELTRGALEAALKARGIGLIRPATPFRPPESPALIDLPRGVFQAVLPDDPGRGYLVVYELPDPSAAYTAASAQAAWLGSGPGAVQFVPGTRHVVTVLGSTVVTYSLTPGAVDPRAAEILEVVGSIGRPVPVPTT